MELPDVYKYGEGIPNKPSKKPLAPGECCKGSPGFRTDYSQTIHPVRGSVQYPSVRIIEGVTSKSKKRTRR